MMPSNNQLQRTTLRAAAEPNVGPGPKDRRCEMTSMMFAIKAEVRSPRAKTFTFSAQKTMYGGKRIAKGETIFVFASENEGGRGLIASGVVTSVKALPKRSGIARQTPRQATNKIVGISDETATYLRGLFSRD
jgi:hypothetical protein